MKPPVIIAAAGPPRAQIMTIASKTKSSAMVAINGNPIVGWILEDLIKKGFDNFILLMPKKDEQFRNYILHRYKGENLTFDILGVEQAYNAFGLAHSLYKGFEQIKKKPKLEKKIKTEGVLIILGQTICKIDDFKNDNLFSEDFLFYDKVSSEVSRWCYIETDKNNYITKLIDKPKNIHSKEKALIGIYYLKNTDLIFKNLKDIIKGNPKAYFSLALEKYNRTNRIKAIKAPDGKWFDCGNVIGINKAKTSMFDVREHNPIYIDAEKGIIYKKNKSTTDLHDEYMWYLGLPKELWTIVPRAIDFDFKKGNDIYSQFSLEYYGYSTLSEAWVYDNWHKDIWYWVIEKLFKILSSFRNYKATMELDKGNYSAIYWDKTIQRIETLKNENTLFNRLFDEKTILINGVEHCGWKVIEKIIYEKVFDLYNYGKDTTIIHGDFHFGNILFDVYTGLIKLIDPRGNFGETGIFGDCKYDLAKLRHSISGGYNFISHDLFHVKISSNNSIYFTLPYTEDHKDIIDWFDHQIINAEFDLNEIKLIEGLLFISMLPLHRDHPERQKAFFTRGIMLLNEIINKNKEEIIKQNHINLFKV